MTHFAVSEPGADPASSSVVGGREQLVAEALDGFVYEWDLVTGNVTRSETLISRLGYKVDNESMTTEWWRARIHPEDAQGSLARSRAAFSDPTILRTVAEFRVRHRDGSWVWIADHARLVRNDAGQVVRLVGITWDVTQEHERREALAAARRENDAARTRVANALALLDGMFADAPIGLAYLDHELRIERINAEMARISGRSVAECIGRSFAEVFPSLSHDAVQYCARVLESGVGCCGIDMTDAPLDSDTEPRHWKTNFFPVRAEARADGPVIAIGITADEVTREVKDLADRELMIAFGASIEHASLASNPNVLLEESLDWIGSRFGVDRCVLSVFRHDSAGAPASSTIRAQFSRVADAPQLGVARSIAFLGDAVLDQLRRGVSLVANNIRDFPDFDTATLESFGVRSFVAVPLHRSGKLVASLSVISATPRIWREREVSLLERFAERLWPALEVADALQSERAIRKETERLAALAEQARIIAEHERIGAQQANQAKSEFLARMSHELRTPLNAIAGHIELLELGVHGEMNEAQRHALQRVQRAQHHLLSIINDVLNFAKLEASRLEFDVRTINLTDVVSDVIPLIEPQVTAKGLQLTICPELQAATSSSDFLVQADREKLDQVLLNLLSNAVKFTPTTRDDGARGTINIGFAMRDADDADTIRLVVSDNGVGIATEKHESVFEPFVQLSTNHRQHGGTGLGLSISRDLVRGMHGEICLVSNPGTGSEFSVLLKRAKE